MRTRLKNKLKRVHIGKDIWQCGAINPKMIVDGKKTSHLVVYGPNRKLFYLYGDDVKFVSTELDKYGYIKNGSVNMYGNYVIEEKLKIFILTSILDNKSNWEFDLTKIPNKGKLKVIYDNGTVKNIDFNGEKFEPVIVMKKYWENHPGIKKTIKPFAYRIK